ncbi:MAG: hypothetical protein ABJC12_12930 [Saprospiraceae bacterium]
MTPFRIQFLLFALFLPIFIACVHPTKNDGITSQVEIAHQRFDTLQKIRVDSIVQIINVGVKAWGLPTLIPLTTFHPNDTIRYWTINNEPERISLAMDSGQTVEWPTFFVRNSELIFVRYRTSHGAEAIPYAAESMVYLKDGTIVYCEERRMNLEAGESPGSLRRKGYTVSTRSLEDIEKDYEKYWLVVKDAINQKTGKLIH